MTLFLDLDGTVLDLWRRYYTIFSDFLILNGFSTISFEQYVDYKRNLEYDGDVLKKCIGTDILAADFKVFKTEKLEAPQYLKYDTIIGDYFNFYKQEKKHGTNIIIITMRKSKSELKKQLLGLELLNFADDIICVQKNLNDNPKACAICDIVRTDDCIIGDSNIDVECGQILCLKTFFVQSGLFSTYKIKSYTNVTVIPTYDVFRYYL